MLLVRLQKGLDPDALVCILSRYWLASVPFR